MPHGPPKPHPRVVVVDLEATCWDSEVDPALAANQSNETETIEIGAVDDAGEVFRAVIRPRRHPVLSEFCTQLTGITQAEVDSGLAFGEAAVAFLTWAGGDDGLVLASWGVFDDRLLRRDWERAGLQAPQWRALNIKRHFSRRAKREGAPRGGWMSLHTALTWAGMTFEGTPHRAVDDACNAARLLAWATSQGGK